ADSVLSERIRVLAILLWVSSLAAVIVAASGLLVLYRDRELERGADLFLRLNTSRYEQGLASARIWPWRLLLKRLMGSSFTVGEWVVVRSVDEIRATLDSDGSLEGLPFMAEM